MLTAVSAHVEPSPAPSPRPDRASPSYLAALSSALRWDPEREETYLQLPSFPELRLVPFREGIEDELVELFNHPVIGQRLYRLPYPFPRSFAEEMLSSSLSVHRPLLAHLRALLPSSPDPSQPILPVSGESILGFPFKSLYDTSKGKIVGDMHLGITSNAFDEYPMTPEEMAKLPASQQVHDFGYVLDPAYHGRGVMTEVVAVMIDSWAKPWMGIGKVGAYVESDNLGSIAVMRKNGLALTGVTLTDWPEEKGGGQRETGRYERVLVA
ncbi:hypothetical protein EHS25_005434 [Saitozyma podzolica]|uniref:N-acetyltransferase domain-containing protein n=1 Tax=Saitozyma podzolica TaxID=1890683 RepID=A0A427XY92_9TREE|nr:hypothetical protein EHS25_005434 [Saitozyma podzolica]